MDLHQLQQRNQELSILNTIAQDLNKAVELEKALDATLKQTVHLLNLQTGWIWLTNAENETTYIAASYNLPPVFHHKPQLLNGTCYCIDKYLKDNLENASNISEITCTRLKNLSEGTKGLRFHASVPLFGRKDKIGIMNVLSEDSQELSESQLQLLYTIGDMLSIAIERARLFENSKQLGVAQERNRLAREIHDTLAQGLSGITLKLETIQAFLENGKLEKIDALLNQTLDLTRSNLEEARRSVLDLRATPLQGNNLVEALEKLVIDINDSEKLMGSFEVIGTYQKLELRIELGLFRIAQEAIRNIIKHANCENFWLRILFENEKIILTIKDDGKGFEVDQHSEGFGLVGIAERAHLLKGKVEIVSEKEKGSILKIEIPVNNE
jgi:two-component system NarL family sensor kinase